MSYSDAGSTLKYVFPMSVLVTNPEIYSPKPDNPSFLILVSCNNGIPRKPGRLLFFNSLWFQGKSHLKLLRSGVRCNRTL